jgi:hypothetical protein
VSSEQRPKGANAPEKEDKKLAENPEMGEGKNVWEEGIKLA